jgi:LysM repeat protein/ABC-type branched-subunit amino acid transport system substrate-binding protein
MFSYLFSFRVTRIFPALFFLLVIHLTLVARENPDTENLDVKDKKYAFYTVIKGDTPYSIARKFSLTTTDLFTFNPQAKQGIHEGDELKIPTDYMIHLDDKTSTGIQRVTYIVGRKETLYSISRIFNTTQEEILKANPTLKGVLESGTILQIPISTGVSDAKPIVAPPSSPDEYTLVSGDNYYQLKQRLGFSQSQLEELNPILKDGFKAGMVIRLPTKAQEAITEKMIAIQPPKEPEPITPLTIVATDPLPTKSTKNFDVGVFLPFCQNQSDSVRAVQRANNFLEFYSGILMADEKLTASGMNIKLHVYDTCVDTMALKDIVKSPEFLSLDLVIGPVFPAEQTTIAALCFKNHIPMVSPLSSDSRFVSTTPGYYLVNPGKKLRLATTADYISTNFSEQNIIMIRQADGSGDDKFLLDKLISRLGSSKVQQCAIATEDGAALEARLKDDVDNIFVLAEVNEADVSVAMTRLNTLSKTHKIKVIGVQEYVKMQSIDIEYFHNANLHYLAPSFIDFENAGVERFVGKYRLEFGAEPSQYSFQGYDIALHFMGSLGKPLTHFLTSDGESELLQATYRFDKPASIGGYMNRSLYVIEYSTDYEVRNIAKLEGVVGSE